jgi:hypothetical protein
MTHRPRAGRASSSVARASASWTTILPPKVPRDTSPPDPDSCLETARGLWVRVHSAVEPKALTCSLSWNTPKGGHWICIEKRF